MSLRPQSPYREPIEAATNGNLTISPSGMLRRRVSPLSEEAPIISRKRRHISAFEEPTGSEMIFPTVEIRRRTMSLLWQLYSGTINSLGLVWNLCHGLIKQDRQSEDVRKTKRIKLEIAGAAPIEHENSVLPGSWLPGSSNVSMTSPVQFDTALTSPNRTNTIPGNISAQQSFDFGGTSTPYHGPAPSFLGDASALSLYNQQSRTVNNQNSLVSSTPAKAANFLKSIFRGSSSPVVGSSESIESRNTGSPVITSDSPDAKSAEKMTQISRVKRQTEVTRSIIPLKGETPSFSPKNVVSTFQSTPIRASSFFKERRVSATLSKNDDNQQENISPIVHYGTALTESYRANNRSGSRRGSTASSHDKSIGFFNCKQPANEPVRKRRKSLVGEKFREALKTGHIKDIGRNALQPSSRPTGFPLSYQDETFYHEFFARAQKRHSGGNDIRTSFIYSSKNSKDSFLELPTQSPASAKREKYEAIHASRLKLEKQIKDLKLGRAAIEPLTSSAINQVNQYLSKPKQQDDLLIASDYKVDIRLRDLKTLRPATWLNDNIIDFFLAAVTDDAKLIKSSQSFAFSTHFFSTLSGPRGYDGVSRWAKRKGIDVTKMDYLFAPINQNNTHWCLGLIDNKHRQFVFYNSLSGGGGHALDILEDYMVKESTKLYPEKRDKFKKLYASYEKISNASCPQQTNGSDCGVFTCTNVQLISHEKELNYSQEDMPMMRKKMAYSIISHGQKKAKM